jgi:3-deoxy-manno-octulosonate cytidylyltransferase (CMP-KDO synthetase)
VRFKVYIPARYASTRLPGKPLIVVHAKPLIQHVYERACASGASAVVIATDDERIADTARGFNAEVCMTSSAHLSGTDRIAEAVRTRGEAKDTIIVNLQGDEPNMPASVIRQVAALVKNRKTDMGTVCEPFEREADWRDANQVKVVRGENDRALYFSRAPIPYSRDAADSGWAPDLQFRRHVGIYSYTVGYLLQLIELPPHSLELREKLEQLRALAHGATIAAPDAVAHCGVGIDTPADLERWQYATTVGTTR